PRDGPLPPSPARRWWESLSDPQRFSPLASREKQTTHPNREWQVRKREKKSRARIRARRARTKGSGAVGDGARPARPRGERATPPTPLFGFDFDAVGLRLVVRVQRHGDHRLL